MARGFTAVDVPDQSGKTILVTGANTGLGYHTAEVLAGKGARVLMGCRNPNKADAARLQILEVYPDADVEVVLMDLGDLASVRAAAERVKQEPRLDVLVNNAGIMIPPFAKTTDGFESQFGVNHLGTFALTGLLLEKLEQTPGSRVVITSSMGHRMGKVDFDDLNAEKGYNAFGQYALSKLANLLHMYELDRRLRAKGSATIAVAVHPGASDTELSRYMGKMLMFKPLAAGLINTPAQGAWPTLMGTTAPDVVGGEYFGPSQLFEVRGPAKRVGSNKRSRDEALAARLWDVSVEMTGVDPGI